MAGVRDISPARDVISLGQIDCAIGYFDCLSNQNSSQRSLKPETNKVSSVKSLMWTRHPIPFPQGPILNLSMLN